MMAKINLSHVTLDFPIYGANTRSLKKSIVSMMTGGAIRQPENSITFVRALEDIHLDLTSGDTLALIGHNGAGKSTLLRVLSKIYTPSIGHVKIRGRISSLLDLNLGIDSESTGYENIILSGLLRGMPRRDIEAKQKAIAEFSELGDYLAMPVRTYSSGMQLRLAFSIATSFSPEILLLDEVMGVGDASFMERSKERMKELVAESDIVVFSSHSTDLVKKFCKKALWLEKGHVKAFGLVDDVLNAYNNANNPRAAAPTKPTPVSADD
jgi:ABC-type polysaccharide/polyol phosphate transport system ATPase subunit